MIMQEADQKRIAVEFLNLGLKGKFEDGLKFFSVDCKTHNPYVAGNIRMLISAMDSANAQGTAQYPDAEFKISHVLVEGDIVAVHTELLSNRNKPSEGGLRQVHLFRFEGRKVVEYWDITQQILPAMPNAAGAF
jgi:predicted SnoaL-like aldol condensation-catalyzing enzyme